MRMLHLAWTNFKGSTKSYFALVVSLAFTVLVVLNFQNIIYSETFLILSQRNKSELESAVKSVIFVLFCFIFFFVWYATNVFLNQRKREIGIYTFMGLSNQKIGRLYMLETSFIGLAALGIGVVVGTITSALFQMIILAISNLPMDISFQVKLTPILITTFVYIGIYFIFVIKGYFNIVRSSVQEMISANKRNEYEKQNSGILLCKALIGCVVLGIGFYVAIGKNTFVNMFEAVVYVVIGIYLFFGGVIPLIFQGLCANKRYLYKRERTLWINNMVFRMKTNYRTYAMVSVLYLSAVTALAAGFAMNVKYHNILKYRSVYTFQLLSKQEGLDDTAREIIQRYSDLTRATSAKLIKPSSQLVISGLYRESAITSFSQIQRVAQEVGFSFEQERLSNDELIACPHMTIFSTRDDKVITIAGKDYQVVATDMNPYLGYIQELGDMLIVSDEEYERLALLGEEVTTYNYQILDAEKYDEIRKALDEVVFSDGTRQAGRVSIDPKSTESAWLAIMYGVCIFVFLVFVMASGCIMFMRLLNDSFAEQERYKVLRKIGITDRVMNKAIGKELAVSYGLPFLVTSFCSYFSVKSLGNVMREDLFSINVVSVIVSGAVFVIFYFVSYVMITTILVEKNTTV